MSKANRNRILSAILAVATLLSMVSVSGLSVEAEAPQQTQPPVSNIQQVLPEDHDTLKITVDGKEAVSLELLSYQKIDITATGLDEKASYQWQILHPEKENQWVNIFDATEAEIPVTAALIKNMLTAEGTAKLRCRAVTDSYAYLTPAFTVTLVEETAEENLEQSVTLFSAPVPLADDPVPEFVTVTIEYVQFDFLRDAYGNLVYDDGNLVYDDGKQAFTSYMATIHGGTDLKTTVHFPTMIGYDSYFQDQATPSTSYAINLTNVTSDVVFTVKYMPAEVEYSVRYFFQNIYDDMYVEDVSMKVTTEGRTGAEPPDSLMKPEVDGFTALYHQPDAIAADGSTVFEVFYERNYYLMEFDCNGGYGTETLYLRYGSYISVPVPVRHGYVFGNNGDGNGWDLHTTEKPGNTETLDDGHGNPLPATMPHYNSAYTAIWDVSETSYTVVYWRENANDNGYSYWDSLQIGLLADGETYDGTVHSNDHISGTDAALRANSVISQLSEYQYFTYNEKKTLYEESKRTDLASDGKIVVEGDGSTVINVYFSRNVYTLTLTDDSVSSCQIEEHDHTDECYEYACESHVHSTDCYVCKLSVHTHSDACCSLYHVHSDTCAGNCPHKLHDITCYTASTAPVDAVNQTGFTQVTANAGETPKEAVIYRYATDQNSSNRKYHNYIYVGQKWYYLGTGSGNSIAGLSWSGNNPDRNRVAVSGTVIAPSRCPHTAHGVTCYNCGKTPHTHAADETCDLLKCPNGGEEHDHTPACYLCNKEEVSHTTACCSKEPHAHTSCSAANCNHKHTFSCYSSSTPTPATNSNYGYQDYISKIANPDEGYVYRYCRYNYNGYYYNYVYINNVWYYLNTSDRNTASVGGFTWSGTASNSSNAVTKSTAKTETNQCTHTTHEDKCYTCGKIAHAHGGDSCDVLNCTDPTHHSHSDACYLCDHSHVHTEKCPTVLACGLVEHKHSTGDSGLNGKIVKIIQAKYGAYIGDEWTFTTSGGYTYPESGRAASWMPVNASSISLTQRLALIDVMPGLSFELYDYPRNQDLRYYNYYIECLDGEEADVEYDGRRYRHYFASGTLVIDFTKYTEAEDFFAITGFTKYRAVRNGSVIYDDTQISSGQTVNFYYNRKTYKLKYFNYNDNLRDASNNIIEKTLSYQEPLAEYNILKENVPYPGKVEPGSLEFVKWYTTPECFPGTEVDWVNGVMPDVDEYLEIYAKWTPVLRNVTFYSAYSDVPSATNPSGNTPFMTATGVPHGTTVGSAYFHTPEWPDDLDTATNGGALSQEYDFVGWFYMDEDNKKKFAPDSMEITRDLILFAEWQTGIDTTYEVQYVLKEDASQENTQDGVAYPAGTQIADTVSAHSSVGKTKTFAAKGLGELKEAFRKKFFPTVNTHSILMEPNGDLNKYTFEYVYDDTVYFKVRYLDYSTKEELKPSKVDQTDEAIITEKFLPIQGYVPQSFYIRKTLAYDGSATKDSVIEENVITFYYVKDTQHGLYSIEYYLENEDSTDENNPANYYQYESIVGSDDLNHNITAPIRTYSGFTYKPDMNTVITYKENGEPNTPIIGLGAGDPPTGKVNYTGLTIKIYYQRNEYPYIIEYRENGAPADAPALDVIADGIGAAVPNDQKNYDAELKHTALATFEKNGILYEYYISNATEEQRTKTIAIRESVTGEENKLIFYYKKHEVNVLYIPVCKIPGADDYGVVSLYSEYSATASALSGSNATAGSGFVFVGWFMDEKCTVPVDTSWRYDPGVGDGDDTPNPSGTKLRPQTLDAKADEVRYYALFEPVTSNLTITKTVTGTSRKDTFLFNIKGLGKNSYIDMVVSISGSGSAVIDHIPIGDYTITELTGWSWQYGGSPEQSTITITTEAQSVAFTNNYNGSDWLTGEHGITNQFSNTP